MGAAVSGAGTAERLRTSPPSACSSRGSRPRQGFCASSVRLSLLYASVSTPGWPRTGNFASRTRGRRATTHSRSASRSKGPSEMRGAGPDSRAAFQALHTAKPRSLRVRGEPAEQAMQPLPLAACPAQGAAAGLCRPVAPARTSQATVQPLTGLGYQGAHISAQQVQLEGSGLGIGRTCR